MSIETWKAEFLPVPAEEVPEEEAVAHSLRKWKGLRPENLAEHDLIATPRYILDQEGREECVSRCALCKHYDCIACPLAQTLGDSCVGGSKSPWYIWFDDRDPEPMIQALEETLQREEQDHENHC